MTIRNTVYELTITTRSPLHIGTGRELVRNYDFLFDETAKIAYMLDAEAVLLLADEEWKRRDTQLRKRATDFDAKPAHQQTEKEEQQIRTEAQTLKEIKRTLFTGLTFEQLREARLLNIKRHLEARVMVAGRPVVRYALSGMLSHSANVYEQVKNAHGQPYLPGSSLKGALRTILAWYHFPELQQPVSLEALQSRRTNRPPDAKFAGENYETALFVVPTKNKPINEQNRDILRMLQVGDSTPVAVEHLILAPITVYGSAPPTGQVGQPKHKAGGMDVLNVEALDRDVTLHARLHIERYPFVAGADRQRGLDFAACQSWLDTLPAAGRARSEARIAAELAYYQQKKLTPLVQFYAGLQDELRQLDAQSFLLQLGWGSGWGSTTLDDRLQAHSDGFAAVVQHYKLDQPIKRKASTFRSGDSFPATRKLVLNQGQPWWPLGWVRVEMREVPR